MIKTTFQVWWVIMAITCLVILAETLNEISKWVYLLTPYTFGSTFIASICVALIVVWILRFVNSIYRLSVIIGDYVWLRIMNAVDRHIQEVGL